MNHSKVVFQSGVTSLSVEGEEDFIREVLGMWESLAKASPTVVQAGGVAVGSTMSDVGSGAIAPSTGAVSQYENVFEQIDGKLKIIATVPGGSKADKMRNVVMILAYGHYLSGHEQIPAEWVREACLDQACYDASNFASSLKTIKDKIAMNAKPGGSYELKLTAPGRKAAKDLVESLNQ